MHLCVDVMKSYRSVCQVWFFRDEKCYLIMLFAVLSAEDLPLLPDAAGMFAAGYSDLIFFLNWIAKRFLKLQASFHPFRCQPTDRKKPGCRLAVPLAVITATANCTPGCTGESPWPQPGSFSQGHLRSAQARSLHWENSCPWSRDRTGGRAG